MIKNMPTRITVDKRGKITSGMKAMNTRGVEYPKSLDYFNIDDFPELKRSYGEKPKKLVLFFPSDEIADFFDCNFVLYGKNHEKIRQCDGEECLHRIKETVGGKTYEPGEVHECLCFDDSINDLEGFKPCKYVFYLKAYIGDVKLGKVNNPLCYLFQSGSRNSGTNIYSELLKIKSLNMGILRGVPFGISVEMISGREDAKMKFPIWHIQAIGMLDEIKSRTEYLMDIPKKQIEAPKEEGLNKEAQDMFAPTEPQKDEGTFPWDKPIKEEDA